MKDILEESEREESTSALRTGIEGKDGRLLGKQSRGGWNISVSC